MAISAKDVMELRKQTDCGMMECKKALTQADGDFEKAIEILREQGLAAANKKAGRIAAEGMVYAVSFDNCAVVVEVNAETDFVAKNDKFVEFTKNLAKVVADENPADVEALMACKMGEGTVDDPKTANKPDAIKEKMAIGKLGKFYKESCLVDQAFIKDGGIDVKKYVADTAKALGGEITIASYTHFTKGEGLEKRNEDFAAEVAAAIKG